MKLLCINDKEIERGYIIFIPKGLVAGKEYTSRGKSYRASDGELCYHIEGFGERLCCRFVEVQEESEVEVLEEELELMC
jgi:hypothetical protein